METITRKKIEQSCLQTIAVEMGLKSNDLNTEMNLRDDLDIVSLDAMNIIMALEDEFKIEADIETVLEMQKVSDIIDHLEIRINS
ncbi:MAG TPA: acyl carrier protein [Candidatus Lambdaproteobacteria bacterium]|jgi:acyl carrier protein|uniref:Acyl carrier protein n=2 Tax=root TaxID=1 RepID=A0A432H3N1_9DELT|nr:acyl carrier protein [SAR324 cluster bacterium]MCK5901101.1 acyl carrier protein [bacterium]HBD28212.1 acyl carrier protein [Deltaproteobacteria bacterium]HHZ87192.1 acyl carrier protein [Candidatus Lambdaproteobacteria bacterium]MBL4736997.1 acyl carrier protein [SAR324 cluster bacterium]|tara:strand:- start:1790 stop:2044 length:255 start_codon:yes stop_codon:yes gene_type:complete